MNTRRPKIARTPLYSSRTPPPELRGSSTKSKAKDSNKGQISQQSEEIFIDKMKIQAVLDNLLQTVSSLFLSATQMSKLTNQLSEIKRYVTHINVTIFQPNIIYQEFWGKWNSFAMSLHKGTEDDQSLRSLAFCVDQLEKIRKTVINSENELEDEDRETTAAFAQVYSQFEMTFASMRPTESLNYNNIMIQLKKLGISLTSNSTFIFPDPKDPDNLTPQRNYRFCIQSLDRLCLSVRSLINGNRLRDQIYEEFNSSQKKLHKLIPDTMENMTASPEPTASNTPQSNRTITRPRKHPNYDPPVRVNRGNASIEKRSVTPPPVKGTLVKPNTPRKSYAQESDSISRAQQSPIRQKRNINTAETPSPNYRRKSLSRIPQYEPRFKRPYTGKSDFDSSTNDSDNSSVHSTSRIPIRTRRLSRASHDEEAESSGYIKPPVKLENKEDKPFVIDPKNLISLMTKPKRPETYHG